MFVYRLKATVWSLTTNIYLSDVQFIDKLFVIIVFTVMDTSASLISNLIVHGTKVTKLTSLICGISGILMYSFSSQLLSLYLPGSSGILV